MSMSIGMEHANWKRAAEARGWHIPPPDSRLAQPDWYEAWIRYWMAMDDYERKVAAGDPDPGRPVQPHRSGWMTWRGGPKAFYAQGRLKPGQMNKSEASYSAHLERMKNAGQILWYRFEALKLRLADNTFYTPDFAVLAADYVLECHEVKGFWQDDARAKIKIAAEMYPFRFKAFKAEAKKRGGGYIVEDFSGIPAEPQDNPAPPLKKYDELPF